MTKKIGIKTKGFFIVGSPHETESTIEATHRLMMSTSLDDVVVTFFTPYPGIEIWNDLKIHGTLEREWDKMTHYDIAFVPNGLHRKNLISSQRRLLRDFYIRPRTIFSYLFRIRSFATFKELIFSAVSFIRYLFLYGR